MTTLALAPLSIPFADLHAFHLMPEAAQVATNEWIRLVNRVRAERHGARLGATIARIAGEEQIGSTTLRRRWDWAIKKGWRGCIDGKLLGHGTVAVNDDFRRYWHGLVLENKRNSAAAYDRFLAAYKAGDPIPGLPPSAGRRPDPPRGLGKRNLSRPVNMPPKAALEMARGGMQRARAQIATGPQDLSAIRPLEYIVFDDVELDFLIAVPEIQRAVKVRLIVAMDLCSRVILGYGVRPAMLRPDGVEDSLKLTDMKAVVARVVRTWGVPLDYDMHFICERATAAIPDALKAALAEISEGRIVVHDTSMIVGQVFEWKDKATGNSWGKAWLESFFNSLHNALQHLPGQKGRRYDLAPAELHGRQQQLALIQRMGQRIPLDLRLEFQCPFLNLAEALQELDDAFARLAHRTDHRLLSFDEVGIWRIDEGHEWKPQWELPLKLAGISAELQWDTRPEKPIERFERRLPALEHRLAIHESSLQRLMDEQRRVRFDKMAFTFERQRVDYTYLPPEGLLPHLTEGDFYILWFHPSDMAHVYVTRDRPHLGYLGCMTRFTAGRRGDLEDAKKYLSTQKSRLSRVATQVQETHIDRFRRAGDDCARNADLGEAALSTLDVEIDVVKPGHGTEGTIQAASVAAMNGDVAEHAATRAEMQRWAKPEGVTRAAAADTEILREARERHRAEDPESIL